MVAACHQHAQDMGPWHEMVERARHQEEMAATARTFKGLKLQKLIQGEDVEAF